MIKGLFLDFGGVIADEGYRDGLYKVAQRFNLNGKEFFTGCADLIYETGYIIGRCSQKEYFDSIRNYFKIQIDDNMFEQMILNSFKIRRPILEIVQKIREKKITTAILSDQTDWLDKLNKREDFFHYFDFVFNSYFIGMGKRDINTFRKVAQMASLNPGEIIFIDDQLPNIERANKAGIIGICLGDEGEILEFLQKEFLMEGR
ncbi:MAG: HAD-IA family hydrolase [Myxococcota bacterium]